MSMAFFSFCILPHRHVSNLPHLTLAKHEVWVEQVCCQVRWGAWARGSLAAEVFPGFLCGRKTRAFPTIWFRLAVDPSLSQAFIWFRGTKWVSRAKVWFQVDSSLAAGTWSGIVAARRSQLLAPLTSRQWALVDSQNTKWMLIVTGMETFSHHLRKSCLLWGYCWTGTKLGRWTTLRQL